MLSRRAFLGSAAASAAYAQPARPNVLFISVDDMNDWVGCLGHPTIKTPNIDRLAQRGVLFADAHCAAPLCNPSRTALLTGMRASSTGVYDNEQYWRPTLPGVETLPMYFRKHGYHVAGAGKVFHHVAGFNPPDQWDEFQLQEFDDPWYRRDEWYPWNKKVPAPQGHPFNGLQKFQGEFDWGVLSKPEAEYGDQRAVDFGAKFLNRPQPKPFFLAVGLWHPHIPMFAPQNYFDMYKDAKIPDSPPDDLNDVPEAGRKFAAFRRNEHERIVAEGKWKDAVQAYMACITFADAMIGRLLDALDASPHARNTVIVFWSDNGWHLGEKQHWHKSTLWQRSTHVPMIFAGEAAGLKQTGTARRQPVSLLDIYPTLVDLCGLPANPRNEGTSLRPLLGSAGRKWRPTVSTYLQNNHAVIDEQWRYIRYADGSEELYDRRADPHEHTNVAGEARHTRRKQAMARWIPAKNVAPVPDRSQFDFDFATHTYKRR
ncbi:MAG: sulfatase [Bryobacterales bacterium]|nr:sulfatase [Bryobacterales bacterium]